jgi:hypothetical protein
MRILVRTMMPLDDHVFATAPQNTNICSGNLIRLKSSHHSRMVDAALFDFLVTLARSRGMDKFELQNWTRESIRDWQAFLDLVGSARMDKPGVVGSWSMKDVVAHLTDWEQHQIARLKSALRGEPEPTPPWSAELQDDDEVNAWIYERNYKRSVNEVLDDTQELFRQILTTLADLPDNTRIETVKVPDGREFHFVWVGDQRFPVGEFFNHFRDDHEQEVRSWLAQQEQPSE